ncbi:MAG: small-conductance mechanosensitive channel [Myxococcota bacterium]|jgi:small-conductance mechanosensitive channel
MGMGSSSLDFVIFVWLSEPGQRDIVTDAVDTRAVKALVAHDITIPFPQQDVWIRGLPPGKLD